MKYARWLLGEELFPFCITSGIVIFSFVVNESSVKNIIKAFNNFLIILWFANPLADGFSMMVVVGSYLIKT